MRPRLVFVLLSWLVQDRAPSGATLADFLLSLPKGDLWEDAAVRACLDYVVQSKHLRVAQEWQGMFQMLLESLA